MEPYIFINVIFLIHKKMSPQKTMWAPFIVFRPMDKFELIDQFN